MPTMSMMRMTPPRITGSFGVAWYTIKERIRLANTPRTKACRRADGE